MRSSKRRLRLVTPRKTIRERSTIFTFLLLIPVIAGFAIAIWQSEALTYLVEWPGETLDSLLAQITEQLQRFRRS